MIIPHGTQIHVDAHGQLSIRTPGNLVVQNSGSYSVLESISGSIRIEPNVQVEAVTVKCAETCYVQGSLTAWQVVARTLHLDGSAQAHVVMQQTERMEVGRNARLVGNFQSEKELFVLFSRFTRQVQALPFSLEGEDEAQGGESQAAREAPRQLVVEASLEDIVEATADELRTGGGEAAASRKTGRVDKRSELPEDLFFAAILLEREAERSSYGPASRRIVGELVKLLRGGDLETLRHTHQTLFSRVREPGEDLRRARRLVMNYFEPG